MCVGHLHNAVRQKKLLSEPWKDMELLISLQSVQKFFMGDRSKGLDEYLKRFSLCMGCSATTFEKNRRKNAPIERSKRPLRAFCSISAFRW